MQPAGTGSPKETSVLKILILGGYGVFGGRLAELLSDIPQLELVICGRNLDRARRFCAAFEGQTTVRPLKLDRKNVRSSLESERPDIVVDASGPFQDYGVDPYGVVKACVSAKIDYLDFADAADFVVGISQFDEEAKSAGVFALSGVSSFPVLTAAVLQDSAQRMEITSVEGGIAPSPHAGIGLNVMRAVLGYAGAPVKLVRDGREVFVGGLTECLRFTIAPPGHLPLRNILFSLVAVPDLQVLPRDHRSIRDIWMGAGTSPEILNRILTLLARVRATLKLRSLVAVARPFHAVAGVMAFGDHRGGMFVHTTGTKDGMNVGESWHLLAEGDDGPYIPSMAIEGIVRKIMSGVRPNNGARPAAGELDLQDYQRLFDGRKIETGFRPDEDRGASLYRQVLGSAFEALPPQLKRLHGESETRRWSGIAEVRNGTNVIARLIRWLVRFPHAANAVPTEVVLSPLEDGELWTRDFGGSVFSSIQTAGSGKSEFLLIERFGIINVALALVVREDRLYLIPRRWSCLGVPLPKFLLPFGEIFETERDNKFCFNVEIAAPLIGLIVAYKGELEQQAGSVGMNQLI